MSKARSAVLITVILAITVAGAGAEYSPWSFGGGLNLIYNSDGAGVTTIPGAVGIKPGGLSSAPSPISGYITAEYRLALGDSVAFAPSASLYFLQYLWDDGTQRALPAEIENRTAFVPNLFIDLPFLYHFRKNRFDFAFGGGPAFIIRYGFLDSGVSAGEIYEGYETLTAGEQVSAINSYLWNYGRWFCPTIQAGFRYELENGWGAGLTLRLGIPVSNLWSSPAVPFVDSMMIMASLVVIPPLDVPKSIESIPTDSSTVSVPSLDDTTAAPAPKQAN